MHLNNKSVPLIKLSDVRPVKPSDFSDFRPFIAVRTSPFVIMWLTCFMTIKNEFMDFPMNFTMNQLYELG